MAWLNDDVHRAMRDLGDSQEAIRNHLGEWTPVTVTFNENRQNALVPGGHLVVDEIMISWRGAEGKYSAEGLPHVTKIAMNTEGVGAEMKATSCW